MATKKSAKSLNVEIISEVTAASKAIAPAVKRLKTALSSIDPSKLPIGALSDLLYDLRQVGKLMNTITSPIDEVVTPAIKLVEEHFIQTLAVGESSGVQGHKSRVQVTDAVIPTIEDWTKFYAHIKKTGEFELLNRAVNKAAVSERWEAKKNVPGVGKFHAKKVSCTKLSGK